MDYTYVFNLLMVLPGLKTYVEAYQHLKQELNQGFLESNEGYKEGNKVCYFVNEGNTAEYKRWYINGQIYTHCFYKNGR